MVSTRRKAVLCQSGKNVTEHLQDRKQLTFVWTTHYLTFCKPTPFPEVRTFSPELCDALHKWHQSDDILQLVIICLWMCAGNGLQRFILHFREVHSDSAFSVWLLIANRTRQVAFGAEKRKSNFFPSFPMGTCIANPPWRNQLSFPVTRISQRSWENRRQIGRTDGEKHAC